MGCCGKNRLARLVEARPDEKNGPVRAMLTPRTPSAQYFEYVGKTGLTVLGPVTGRRYRFPGPGALLAVDGRDGPALAGVPNLRWTVAPESP